MKLASKLSQVTSLKVLAALLAFTLDWYIANQLGPNEAGVYFFSLSTIMIVSVLSRLGLDNLLVRDIPKLHESQDSLPARKFWVKTTSWGALSTIVCSSLLWLATKHGFVGDDYNQPLTLMCLGAVSFNIMWFAGSYAQATHRPSTTIVLQGLLLQSVLICSLYLSSPSAAFQVAMLWMTIATVLAFASFAALAWPLRVSRSRQPTKIDWAAAKLMWGNQALAVGQNYGTTVVLGFMVSAAEIAWFYAANRVSIAIALILFALNTIIAPRISVFFAASDMEGMKTLLRRSVRLIALVATPPLLVLLVYPVEVLQIFGGSYAGAASALQILALAQLLNVLTGPVGICLLMCGQERVLLMSSSIGFLTLFLMCVSLVPLMGITGAAIAVAFSKIVTNGLNVWLVRKRLGVFMPGLLIR
ncbi:MAG: polysaccharide biosynthesis C-terminal domain-containing protein [Pseudomonadota bacterium]